MICQNPKCNEIIPKGFKKFCSNKCYIKMRSKRHSKVTNELRIAKRILLQETRLTKGRFSKDELEYINNNLDKRIVDIAEYLDRTDQSIENKVRKIKREIKG